MIERTHVGLGHGLKALGACALETSRLLGRRGIHQPRDLVGTRCSFADGSTAVIYRETVVNRPAPAAPTVLVVSFRLRRVRRAWAHSLFRLESELNTVLFVGFPGFVSKLWFAADAHGVYRGLYEWDDPVLAEEYVRALWWALRVVSAAGSIHYAVLPQLQRDELLRDPHLADGVEPDDTGAWWRLTEVLP